MKTMVRFSLEKRFLNKTAIILNIIVFLALGIAFHVDKITGEKEEYPIYLDYSCSDVTIRLMNTDKIYINNKNGIDEYHILHYENGWRLYLYGNDNRKLRNKVETDLRNIRKEQFLRNADLKEKKFLEDFSQSFETEVYHKEFIDINTVIVSVVFYLILTYSNMISNELVYEKASHTLELVMGIVGERAHLFSKIITAYLSLMIQVAMVVISAVIWIFIRFAEDHLKGLITYLNKSAGVSEINIPLGKIALTFIIVISGLLLLQIIMMIITSCLSGSEEVTVFQNIYYIVLVAGYYFFILKGESGIMTCRLTEIMSFIPVASMLTMPIRLFSDSINMMECFASIVITVTVTVITVEVYLRNYRRLLTKK